MIFRSTLHPCLWNPVDDPGVCTGLPGAIGRDIKATKGQLRVIFISRWKQAAHSSAVPHKEPQQTFQVLCWTSVGCQRKKQGDFIYRVICRGGKKSHLSFPVREELLIGRCDQMEGYKVCLVMIFPYLYQMPSPHSQRHCALKKRKDLVEWRWSSEICLYNPASRLLSCRWSGRGRTCSISYAVH